MNATAGKRLSARPGLRERIAILRRRNQYLVDAETQFQIVRQFVVVLIVGAALGICNVHVIATLWPVDRPGQVVDWAERGMIIGYIVTLLCISVTLMYLLCLFYSHRVGGPTMKIAGALLQMSQGDLVVHVRLRESDLLKELARNLNNAARDWRRALQDVEWVAVNLEESATKDPEIAKQVAALKDVLQRYRRSQHDDWTPRR